MITTLKHSAAPPEAQVDQVTKQLFSNADFVIAAVVNHKLQAVRARYARFTGGVAPTSSQKLIAVLQAMRASGRKSDVARIIAVPWEVRNDGSALDRAVRTLKAEHFARLNSSTLAKRTAPGADGQGDDGGTFDPFAGGTVYGPQNNTGGPSAAADPQEQNNWLNSLPGILTGLGGLVGAFTGNIATPSGGAAAPPAPTPTNWLNVGLILVGIAALIVVVAVVIRTVKKK